MRFFKSHTPTRTDPVFGEITYKRGFWNGQVTMPALAEPAVVSIEAGKDGPGPEHRRIYQELLVNMATNAQSIAKALFDLYRPYLEVEDWEGPKPDSPQSLRDMLQLDCVTVLENEPLELLFGFRGDTWPDAMFTIGVDNSRVRPISLDD